MVGDRVGAKPSRASLREVRRQHRKRRRARHLSLVPPVDPRRRPGRILKPLLAGIAMVVAAIWWHGLPPPPPSDDRAPVVQFGEVP